jgi:hypothetical protein
MRIIWRLFGQRPNLSDCETLPLSHGVEAGPAPEDRRSRVERFVAHERPGPPEPDGAYQRLAAAIRAFEVFPSWLLTGLLKRTPLQVGDTFGSCFHTHLGVDLFFAGRVTHSFDEFADGLWRAGFAFQTVQGHPAIGEERFCVEKIVSTGAVRLRIESWSRPALWQTRLAAPFLRWIQTRAVNAALDRMSRLTAQPSRLRCLPLA